MEDERALVTRMRAGEEAAFTALLARYDGALRAMARTILRTPASVDDVVQETWLAVVRGVDRFEGRSSLSTWIFGILMNKARSRAAGDARQVPFSALADADAPAVDPEAFGPDGRWRSAPPRLGVDPEASALSAELRDELLSAVDDLPEAQRTVIALRDIAGVDARTVCEVLEITEANQRVLLHRARARLRATLAPLREVGA